MRGFHLWIALAGALIPSTAFAQATCSVSSGLRMIPGDTAQGSMIVKAGKSCGIRYRGSGFPGGVTETRLVKGPAHGSVEVSATKVRYRPKPGYTGADEFVYAREGLDRNGRKGVAAARISVTVAP